MRTVAFLVTVCGIMPLADCNWHVDVATGPLHLVPEAPLRRTVYKHTLAALTPPLTLLSQPTVLTNSGYRKNFGCYGLSFFPKNQITVPALGMYDWRTPVCPQSRDLVRGENGDGVLHNHVIALFQASDNALIGSCMVTPSSASVGDINYCDLVNSVSLSANTEYRVCAVYDRALENNTCAGMDPIASQSGAMAPPTADILNVTGTHASYTGSEPEYPATADLQGIVYVGGTVLYGMTTPAASPGIVQAVGGSVDHTYLRLAEQTARVTGDELARAIGATGTITVLNSTVVNTRSHAVSQHSARAADCLNAPYTEIQDLSFSDGSDRLRLADMVRNGDPAVSRPGLCVAAFESSAVGRVTQPSNSVAPTPTSSPGTYVGGTPGDEKLLRLGLGLGLGLGIPVVAGGIIVALLVKKKRVVTLTKPTQATTPAASATPAAAASLSQNEFGGSSDYGCYTYDSDDTYAS